MSALLFLLTVWVTALPLAFGVTTAVLPRYLHRRASGRISVAEVVDIRAARDRRSAIRSAPSYRAL